MRVNFVEKNPLYQTNSSQSSIDNGLPKTSRASETSGSVPYPYLSSAFGEGQKTGKRMMIKNKYTNQELLSFQDVRIPLIC
jgi:hypothetical protein